MNPLGSIFKTLFKAHKLLAATLIALIGLSFMVIGNALPSILSTLAAIGAPSGLREAGLGVLHIEENAGAQGQADGSFVLSRLAAVGGVQQAAVISSLPLQNRALTFNPYRQRGGDAVPRAVSAYVGTPGFVPLLGVHLVLGRDFRAEEYARPDGLLPGGSVAIVSRDLADYLWPGQVNPLGKVLLASNDRAYRVVGVIDRLAETNPRSLADRQLVALFPGIPGAGLEDTFVFRYDSRTDANALFDRVAETVHAALPSSVVGRPQSFSQVRADYFAGAVRTSSLFAAICATVLATMALGVGGLVAYWLSQRRSTIAIRRALGATRTQIAAYFLAENVLLSALGVSLGIVLALAANRWLLGHFEMRSIPWIDFLAGGCLFVFINLCAVALPLRRSLACDPAMAFRVR